MGLAPLDDLVAALGPFVLLVVLFAVGLVDYAVPYLGGLFPRRLADYAVPSLGGLFVGGLAGYAVFYLLRGRGGPR